MILIYQILFGMFKIDKQHEDLVFKLLMAFLVLGPQADNYANAQMNLYVLFFLLSSLYLFEYKKYNFNGDNNNFNKDIDEKTQKDLKPLKPLD